MKNLPLILSILSILGVAHLYYLNRSVPKSESPVIATTSDHGAKIAYVNADTLDARYEWIKVQKEAIENRVRKAENSLRDKQQTLIREMQAFEEKAQSGTIPPAQLEKEYNALMARQKKLAEEEQRLSKELAEEQKKAMEELYANIEAKLKTLQDKIGYDYILSYSRGGQVLLAKDSLDITNEVLNLLNAKDAQ